MFSLKFSINDIEHLIVESDRDVPELIKQIEYIFHNSDQNVVKILISKISSLERLDRDY